MRLKTLETGRPVSSPASSLSPSKKGENNFSRTPIQNRTQRRGTIGRGRDARTLIRADMSDRTHFIKTGAKPVFDSAWLYNVQRQTPIDHAIRDGPTHLYGRQRESVIAIRWPQGGENENGLSQIFAFVLGALIFPCHVIGRSEIKHLLQHAKIPAMAY